MSDLREYVLRTTDGLSGWAIIVLDLDRCYFSTTQGPAEAW